MKAVKFTLSIFVMFALFGFNVAVGQWATNVNDIYNTNSGWVGIGTNSPVSLLHAAKFEVEPKITIQNYGDIGGATFRMVDNLSGADWKFKAKSNGGFKIRDNANGLDVITIDPNSAANSIYVNTAGNVGIGTASPSNQLHVAGAIRIGGTALTNTGSIRWNGMHFQGYNGSFWADLDVRSRARAYQIGATVQVIPAGVWTPVNYTMDFPLPAGYDEMSEFTTALAPGTPTPMENAYFTATEAGYYQVNARCAFQVGDPEAVSPTSFVSIAIYQGPAPGSTTSYAVGNNLQIGYLSGAGVEPLYGNCAPNVSDVVYLAAGEIISIWVFHTALFPLTLQQGPDQLYVSIHRVS